MVILDASAGYRGAPDQQQCDRDKRLSQQLNQDKHQLTFQAPQMNNDSDPYRWTCLKVSDDSTSIPT